MIVIPGTQVSLSQMSAQFCVFAFVKNILHIYEIASKSDGLISLEKKESHVLESG
jgi:hypothetical protein